ncbi:MAG TPA: prolipoprotein diacylglyceryl transferase [Anaerolineales bacterium]|nr:prolipoprotein diacylglyceryl transferase [Anaerolineales bacterium]
MSDGFPLGPFQIRFYGIILMLGALAGAWLATREAKRRGYNPEIVWDLLTYLLIGGIIGARLWHILTPPPSSGITAGWYFTHPLDALAVWKGGLGIPGAVAGGIIVLFFYTRRHKLDFADWTDIAAPCVALGQAIGRWGNFFNQELYGRPTDLPWGIHITNQLARVAPYNDVTKYPLTVTRFHPLFLYESLWNLGNMFFLLWISRRFADRLKKGDVFLIYLIVYPIGRFMLDFLRVDASLVAGINVNQTLMAIVAVLSASALLWRHRRTPTLAPAGDT